MAKAKSAPKKKSRFVAGLVVYAWMLLILGAAAIFILFTYLQNYESLQPKHVLERYRSALETQLPAAAAESLGDLDGAVVPSEQALAYVRQRMEGVLAQTQIDESRILTEAAIYADKVAVDEETVRLRSHLSQLDEMLTKGGAIGRKLDFLIQEFNREANTIGSKCQNSQIAHTVVDLKSEIEKIREQIQNIE